MKYLLCKEKFENEEILKQHYINFYNVDPSNHFFQKLFKSKRNTFIPKRYLRCNKSLLTTKFKIIHDFLKHYSDLFKDKPTNIKNFENITTHKIIVSRHGGHITLRIQNNLLMTSFNNVRSTFRPSGCVIIKYGFAIDNLQSAPFENRKLILNIQYWPTKPYKVNFLNDYTFSSLREDILKRATNNGVTGRS